MYTQVSCPSCQTPFTAEVHQVIDAARQPELKQRLLNGQLNVAVCPSCGMGGQMATALLFHDPAYEMFMVHVPQELSLNHVDQQHLIGQLAQEAMKELPAEQRRAYMLQPQMMLTMQSFMEKVLETEGITPEMIARQRKQAELLQKLATADKDVADFLIKERINEIDETFFAMLQSYVDAAAQMEESKQMVALTNLRARLMTSTPAGRRLEKQQMAMHALNRDAKKADGLSPELLLKHLLANKEDDGVVDALVAAARGALNYSFFSLLSQEIENSEAAGDQKQAKQLENMRSRLLQVYDAMQQESQRALDGAAETLKAIASAEDKAAAVAANMSKIDDAFMYLLSAQVAEADQKGDVAAVQLLNEVHTLIMKQLESQYPPEVILLNQMMEAASEAEQQQILEENSSLVSPSLITMLDNVIKEIDGEGQAELAVRLAAIKALVQSRL